MKYRIKYIILILIIPLASCQNRNIKSSIPDNIENIALDIRVVDYLNFLRLNEFKTTQKLSNIDRYALDSIYTYTSKWNRDSLKQSFIAKEKFEHLFTDNLKEWNFSCIVGNPEPNFYVTNIQISETYLTLFYKTGGLVINSWVTTYKFQNKTIVDHWTIQTNKKTLKTYIDFLLKDEYEICK